MAVSQRLCELQRWMLVAVTDPRGAADREVQEALLSSGQQSAAERLAVYQHAYVARLLEVLREQFPCTRFAAGDDVFDQFALGYLRAHPPHSYTLAHLGDDLPEYLDATRPADWGELLVELARFEQAIDRVFDGPGPEELPELRMKTRQGKDLGQEPLTEKAPLEALSHCSINSIANTGKMPVPPDAGELLRLAFVPGFELHAFRYPVSAFYTTWKAGSEPVWPEAGEQFVALWRRDYVVRRLELSRVQFELLTGLQARNPLGEALAAAAESSPDTPLEQLAASLRDWFSQWTAGGLFASAWSGTGAREHGLDG